MGRGTTLAHGESRIEGITLNAWRRVVPVFSGSFCGGTYETHSYFDVSASSPSAALRSVKLDFLCRVSHTFTCRAFQPVRAHVALQKTLPSIISTFGVCLGLQETLCVFFQDLLSAFRGLKKEEEEDRLLYCLKRKKTYITKKILLLN